MSDGILQTKDTCRSLLGMACKSKDGLLWGGISQIQHVTWLQVMPLTWYFDMTAYLSLRVVVKYAYCEVLNCWYEWVR